MSSFQDWMKKAIALSISLDKWRRWPRKTSININLLTSR